MKRLHEEIRVEGVNSGNPAPRGPKNLKVALAAYLIIVAMMSLLSFIANGLDRRQATKGGRRVPERTLHLMAFLGGWPGALIAQRQFRHKTQKAPFRIVSWMLVVLHIGIAGAVAYAITSRYA
jgi:uncharacterized membrane protein YsdA (DUF1294 family)